MALTAVWMGLAGSSACLAAGVAAGRVCECRWARPTCSRRRSPASTWAGRCSFDDQVDERVVIGRSGRRHRTPWRAARSRACATARSGGGRFEPVAHPARGVATVVRRAGGGDVLTLTSFEVSNGPDLRVYLVDRPGPRGGRCRRTRSTSARSRATRATSSTTLPRGLDARPLRHRGRLVPRLHRELRARSVALT